MAVLSIVQGKKRLIILLLIILLALAIRIPYVLSPLSFLVTHIPDDGFYYLQLASNFAQGEFSTIDGVHLTNGYHPLWPLSIIPFFLLHSIDINLPIRCILIFSFLLNIITARLIAKIIIHLGGKDWLVILTFAVYLLNPFVHKLEMYNEPATLSNLLLTLLLYFTLKFSINNKIEFKQALLFGLFGGLFLLARLDNLPFYALFILVLLVWNKPSPIKNLFFAAAVSGLVILPWFIFNLITFNTIVQVSAIACPYVIKTINPLTLTQLLSFSDPAGLIMRIFELQYAFRYSLILHGFLIIIGLCFAVYKRDELQIKRIITLLLLCTFIGVILLYSHSVIARYLREWHVACFAPISLTMMILIILIFEEPFKKHRYILISSIAAYFLIASVNTITNYTQYPYWQRDVLTVSDWVKTQPKGTVAIYDGGIMSYLTDGACLPIDGNVNNEAHKAVTEHRVYEYMKENGVEYLIGWYWIKGRYSPFWGVDFDQAFEQVKVVEPVEKEPVFGVFTIWKLVE